MGSPGSESECRIPESSALASGGESSAFDLSSFFSFVVDDGKFRNAKSMRNNIPPKVVYSDHLFAVLTLSA